MATKRTAWKTAFYHQPAGTNTVVKTASASQRIGITKIMLNAYQATAADIRVTWGAVAGADYVLPVQVNQYAGIVIRPGDEEFPEEGALGQALNITSDQAFNGMFWGYLEEEV